MKNPNIKLGDLVKLDGLEKPDGVMIVNLWGKEEKVKELGEGLSDLTGKMEDNNDVRAGDVTRLVEDMKKAFTKELSVEKTAELLKSLKWRFLKKKKSYKSPEGVKWEDVQAKLEANPEKLWSLQKMDETDGEPDLIEYDKNTDEYVFMDCSAESPESRRGCVYDQEAGEYMKKNDPTEKSNGNAVSLAALMGVNILSESEYRDLQTKGEFDKNSWSWIKTPIDKRKAGVALRGIRRGDAVGVSEGVAYSHGGSGAFRTSLRV